FSLHRWLWTLDQSTDLIRVDVERLANLLRQHCAAHVTVTVATLRVEPEGWISVAVFVPLRVDAASMQPVAMLFEALPCQRSRNRINDTRVQRCIPQRKVYPRGWLPLPNRLARFERLNPYS